MKSNISVVLSLRKNNTSAFEKLKEQTTEEMEIEILTGGKVASFTYFWIFGRTYTNDRRSRQERNDQYTGKSVAKLCSNQERMVK